MSNSVVDHRSKTAVPHGSLLLFVALAIAAATATLAHADAPPADDPATGICQQILVQRGEIRHASRWRLIWDVIRVKLAPGSIARPAPQFLATPPAQLLSAPGGAVPDGRNLIFSLEPPDRMEYGPEVQKAQARYQEITRELLGMKGTLRAFVQARDVHQCVERVRASHFDFDRFSSLSVEQNSLQWVEQIQDGRVANRLIGRVLPRLRLRWELFRSTDLMTVYQALRSTQVRNVIIVTHALSEGSVIDAAFNEYPSSFFDDISPTIQSISIFSCHGDKVAAYYKVAERLQASPSYHAQRAFFGAQGVKLLGIADVVPIDGVDGFIQKVDRWAAWFRRVPAPGVEPVKPYCELELTGLQVARGGYVFLLNNQFVGAINPATAPAESLPVRVQYPCELASRPRNVLIMRSSDLAVASDVAAPERIQGRILIPGHEEPLPAGTHYRRPDGTYQSSKWIF